MIFEYRNYRQAMYPMSTAEIDPVLEVAIYQQRERIQARIAARCAERLHPQRKRRQIPLTGPRGQAPTTGGPKTISLISDDDTSCCSDTTMEYPDVEEDVPVAVPATKQFMHLQNNSNFPHDPVVPMTIQNLWLSLEQLPTGSLETPCCTNRKCPYNATPANVPIMLQRHNLMIRLLELERLLYGRTMHGF